MLSKGYAIKLYEKQKGKIITNAFYDFSFSRHKNGS